MASVIIRRTFETNQDRTRVTEPVQLILFVAEAGSIERVTDSGHVDHDTVFSSELMLWLFSCDLPFPNAPFSLVWQFPKNISSRTPSHVMAICLSVLGGLLGVQE